MPAIVLCPDPSPSVAMEEESHSATSGPSSFRLLALDGRGSLAQLHLLGTTDEAQAGTLHEVKGPGSSKGELVVQRSATGQLQRHDVIALARKDGRIDVLDVHSARLLVTLRGARMKKGIHRWVGLAVAQDGIFACTSAGHFTFFRVQTSDDGLALDHADSQATVTRELPEPLQQVAFTPLSDPTHFAYGGEEIPLSLWDARQAISAEKTHQASADDEEDNEMASTASTTAAGEVAPLNGRARKRKRAMENRAKARELMWGEVWRARNMPNDNLSLPQRADIVSIAFIGGHTRIAVGTRAGLVRTFDTTTQRKHTHEFRVFAQNKSTVKTLTCSHAGTELIAGDLSGKLFVLDAQSGANLYQFKGINGAIVAAHALPPMTNNAAVSYMVTASADHLVRLHSIPVEDLAEGTPRKSTKHKGTTLASHFMQNAVTSIGWDGVIPTASKDEVDGAQRKGATEHRDGDDVDDEDDDDAPDGMWDAMATIDDTQNGDDESRTKRRR